MSIEQLELNSSQSYTDRMRRLSAERMQPDMAIIDPWSSDISPAARAAAHVMLLGSTYGQGHPGSGQNVEEIMHKQQEGSLLTWIVSWRALPVGMVNFEIQERGIAEAVRSVALPEGTVLPNGDVYSGQANISAAMYQRIPDLLAHQQLQPELFAIEGDVRLAAEIKLPNHDILPSGVRTQHINMLSGLNPYLLMVPRYQVHPAGGVPHQEAFLQSRLYLDPQNTRTSETIYTPLAHPHNRTTVADIARVTYQNAHNLEPHLSDEQTVSAPAELNLEATAGIHFSTVHASGNVSETALINVLSQGLDQSRFVEIIIPNRSENIELQRRLMELPVVPLGVFPGSTGTETTIHFGLTEPDTARQIVEVECAADYDGSELQQLIHQLWKEWKELAT